MTKYIRSTLHRKGMRFPRTLPQTRASWEQLVPQPRQWEVDGSTDPVDIVDPEALTRAWQRIKRAGPSNQMTNEELTLPGGCTACFSRLLVLLVLALSVFCSCVEVKGHNPVMKHLEEILVVFDPLTKKQNVCQFVTYVQVNRRTESVECTMNELEGCVLDGGVGSGCAKSVQVSHVFLAQTGSEYFQSSRELGRRTPCEKQEDIQFTRKRECQVYGGQLHVTPSPLA